MACETCDRLLAGYKRAVHLFTDTVFYSQGTLESDSRLGAEQADRLRQASEHARDALIEHRRLGHNGGFPPKSDSS
jgi:hypothetical protein